VELGQGADAESRGADEMDFLGHGYDLTRSFFGS
jgi:hypothetical protein